MEAGQIFSTSSTTLLDQVPAPGLLFTKEKYVAHIDPSKSWQNGLTESFNCRFHDECLIMDSFKNRIDAKIVIEQFCRQYN